MGAGFFDRLLLDPIIMRRIRAARADWVSLVNVMPSAGGGFDLQLLPLVFFDFGLSPSLESVLLTLPPPSVAILLFLLCETVDCGLSSCCLECTSTPGFSGHLPTAAAVQVVVEVSAAVGRSENDSVNSPPRSSPYPGGGLGVSAIFPDRSGHCGFAGLTESDDVALPSGLQFSRYNNRYKRILGRYNMILLYFKMRFISDQQQRFV